MSISCIIIIINAISVRGIDQWEIRTPQPMPGPSQHKGPGDEVGEHWFWICLGSVVLYKKTTVQDLSSPFIFNIDTVYIYISNGSHQEK